jgi:type IX secretion system PorP/SprF family membrane protein
MKKGIICVIVCICGFSATLHGQHDTQIGSYTFNQVLFNPAFAGNHQRIEATALQRSQFIGFEGAPMVWNFAVSSPFEIFDTRHGAAFTLNSDNIGAFKKMHFAIGYAYWHKLPKAGTKLGVGLSMGAVSYNLNPTWQGITDDAIPATSESSSAALDINVGVYYQGNNFSAGLACTHVNQPQALTLSGGAKGLTVRRTFYLTGDYRWQVLDSLELVPSAMLMAVSTSVWQATLGCNVVYLQKYWGGLSYRIMDAIGINVGMRFKSIRVGLLYEYSLSKMIGFNIGTTEIFASYLFDLNFKRKVKPYKSVRFL